MSEQRPNEVVTCPICGGVGQMMTASMNADGDWREETHECPYCGGKGWYIEHRCPHCGQLWNAADAAEQAVRAVFGDDDEDR